MNQPEPQPLSFSALINDIERGLIKIPQFQRDFVWTKEKSAKLLDSILKGYPIGTFIFWKTRESLRSIRNIGGANLPPTPSGDFIQYVLDGQQRIASLFASLKGLKVDRDNKPVDFSDLYIDLTASEEDDIVIIDASEKDEFEFVKVVDLLNAHLRFLASFPEEYHERIQLYKSRFDTYLFSVILIKEASLDVATEIFTRINVEGKPLSVFEIMVAKTFDDERNFDLAEEYGALNDRLGEVGYETISEATVLQFISILLTTAGECSKKDILHLNKDDFIDTWPDATEAIELAVDYFRNYYRIPVSKLLPYNGLIVPFAYFFFFHKEKPTGEMRKYLDDFFWRTSIGGRYSHSQVTRLAQDIKKIEQILQNELPTYDYPVDTTAEFIIENGGFNVGRSYIKALLCIMAYCEPKSFNDDSIVRINNDWLKQANSKNYHHFFPKGFMANQKQGDLSVNHIVNITIVDDFLNKNKIRDKAPSVYMNEFARENRQIHKTMRTHLIELDEFGIWNDDYEQFFHKRAQALSQELERRVITQEIDKLGQVSNFGDFEETALEGLEET